MATLTKTILENPTQPVSARYGSTPADIGTASRPIRWFRQARNTGLHLTTPAGDTLPCLRHNGQWYNFLIPSETSHLLLEQGIGQAGEKSVAELVLFIGEQKKALPIPPLASSQETDETVTAPLYIDLPDIPYWMTALLCVRIAQREQDHAEQAA